MSIRSVRNIARNCLNIPGVVSIRNDIMTIRDRPPPRMLREELDFIHQTRCRPEAPTDLRVTEVAEDRIGLAWTDNADNEDGFRIRFQGEPDGSQDHEGTRAVQENSTSASLTDLHDGFEYTISVRAFNNAGESAASNTVRATTLEAQTGILFCVFVADNVGTRPFELSVRFDGEHFHGAGSGGITTFSHTETGVIRIGPPSTIAASIGGVRPGRWRVTATPLSLSFGPLTCEGEVRGGSLASRITFDYSGGDVRCR